ncbi:MAG: phosphate acyltransferase PlsX [Halieaceae bacterium]
MDSRVRLAVDAMSGDHGLRSAVPASLQVLQEHPNLQLSLVGDSNAIELELQQHDTAGALPARLDIVHADTTLAMDAPTAQILRGSQGSSLHVALGLLGAGQVDAVVSAGNTTALMALGRRQVDMLHGFSRPAFCSAIPVNKGFSYMLDLGANVDCDARSLHEFALMGTALVSSLEECEVPRVALLSNGREANKGDAVIRLAAEKLAADERLNYCGFVEGDDLHLARAELIVCDGLLGNVALKTAEGTAELAADLVRQSFASHWWYRLLGLMVRPVLGQLRVSLSAEQYGGAFLLGLQGVVVKSHGGSTPRAFRAALEQAVLCVEHKMVPRLAHYLDNQESAEL